jgi:2-polyprenyl-3-methyl-5-hydroxy-6-metoxy-1,4-benzoquinol methylase
LSGARDYDLEIRDAESHQYAYDFDFDVMHRFKIRAFQPFFRPGRVLELGSHEGSFTELLIPYFDDITCLEASAVAIDRARQRLGDQVTFVHGLIESAPISDRYDTVVMTHVLEHVDDPVGVLRRINHEWLSADGRLFVVVPNAHAASRQIAVHMGLIDHATSVTPAEAEHGHRRTYTLETLERDAVGAGLSVVHRSGIFFKALANFQWDRLLQTDIISDGYLEGCFKLGQRYPDLCSSVFLVCERGPVE